MSSKRNILVKNASFLMVAALISKVVGLLYKSPLTQIVGADGMAYYGPDQLSKALKQAIGQAV